jgi:tetratricopeptide (TPR) repeat protein
MTRGSVSVPEVVKSCADLFQRGLTAHQFGQLQAASEMYRQVLRLCPNHADSLHLLGVAAYQSGEGAAAIDYLRRAIMLDPNQAHYHYNLGISFYAVGRTAEAIEVFDAALRLRPDYPEVHYNRGNALKQQGRKQEAVDCYRRALRHRPNYIEAYNNLGNCLLDLGRPERAEAAFRRALRITPDAPEVHYNLGLALRDLGQNDLAIECFRDASRLRPGFVDPYISLAAVLQAGGRTLEAIAVLRRVVALRPDHVEAHEALAAAFNELGGWSEAEQHYQAVLRIDPTRLAAMQGLAEVLRVTGRTDAAETQLLRLLAEHPELAEAHNNLGNLVHQLGRHDEAISHYRRTLELKPDLIVAYVNLGNAQKAKRDAGAAEGSYRTAIELDPDNADAHIGLATLLLRGGRLAEGWPELEWRFHVSSRAISFPERELGRRRWNGEPLAGRTLLLHAEQGFGDTIQFCRYVPEIARLGPVVLEVPAAIVRLMSSLEGIKTVVAYGDPLPGFDLHCPLASLPLVAGTTLATIPATVSYLGIAAEAVARWRQRLEPMGGLRIGLVWGGNPRYPNDRWRSASLRQLAQLASVPGVTFISLQKGPPADQAATPPPGMTLVDWTAELEDFADTAALVNALDLIISTDTSVPHLAGALGKPVWLLTSFDACWRWLLHRDDSPWYPSLRLFRQSRLGDWRAPVEDVCAALHEMVGECVR